MTKATSCGGVVIFRGKILLLYKSYKNRYDGWVLPKGTVEQGETHEQTALREVKEETDADASIIKYVGKSEYSFYSFHEQIIKSVHWYLMESENYHSKPQKEEFFVDSGYYKFHEAYHLLKFPNEKEILKQAYDEYKKLRETNTEELKTLKEQLSAEIKDLISKLEKDADTIRKDMANARNQYILETDKNKIINGVFGITSSVNPSKQISSNSKNTFSTFFWASIPFSVKNTFKIRLSFGFLSL